MALALSKEQLAKLNKKDILQLLLESMEQEKELRSQLAVLTDELKRTNQQMQVILEKWNLAQATRFGRSSEKMTYDTGSLPAVGTSHHVTRNVSMKQKHVFYGKSC